MGEDHVEFLQGLGRNIGRHMEALDISVGELAGATGISRDRIERILTAEVEVGVIELLRLASVLGVFPGELTEGLAQVWGEEDYAPLAEVAFELPLLKAYAGGRREGGRPVEDAVGELLASSMTEADRAIDPGGRERWITRVRLRRRLLLDTGLVGFDPRLRLWDLTEHGLARLRELELCEEQKAAPGPGGLEGGRRRDDHDGRSDVR